MSLELCPYCKTDTAGNHQAACPNNPVKTFSAECVPVQVICNSYGKISKDNISAAGEYIPRLVMGVDLGSGSDYVSISSKEYKRLRKCESELQRYKAEDAKIPGMCKRKDLCCIECIQATECPHAGIGADDGCYTECEPDKHCPETCPIFRKLKYSTFQSYCNKCGHDTEHEQIRDDSSEMIEAVTSCLVCGDHDVDVDSKEQMEDEELYFQMTGDYEMPDMPESEAEDAGDFKSIE